MQKMSDPLLTGLCRFGRSAVGYKYLSLPQRESCKCTYCSKFWELILTCMTMGVIFLFPIKKFDDDTILKFSEPFITTWGKYHKTATNSAQHFHSSKVSQVGSLYKLTIEAVSHICRTVHHKGTSLLKNPVTHAQSSSVRPEHYSVMQLSLNYQEGEEGKKGETNTLVQFIIFRAMLLR